MFLLVCGSPNQLTPPSVFQGYIDTNLYGCWQRLAGVGGWVLGAEVKTGDVTCNIPLIPTAATGDYPLNFSQ